MEDKKFIKQDLRAIGLIVASILLLFAGLYYIELSFGALTKLLP